MRDQKVLQRVTTQKFWEPRESICICIRAQFLARPRKRELGPNWAIGSSGRTLEDQKMGQNAHWVCTSTLCPENNCFSAHESADRWERDLCKTERREMWGTRPRGPRLKDGARFLLPGSSSLGGFPAL